MNVHVNRFLEALANLDLKMKEAVHPATPRAQFSPRLIEILGH